MLSKRYKSTQVDRRTWLHMPSDIRVSIWKNDQLHRSIYGKHGFQFKTPKLSIGSITRLRLPLKFSFNNLYPVSCQCFCYLDFYSKATWKQIASYIWMGEWLLEGSPTLWSPQMVNCCFEAWLPFVFSNLVMRKFWIIYGALTKLLARCARAFETGFS